MRTLKALALFACCVIAACTCAVSALVIVLVLAEIAKEHRLVFLAGAACLSLSVFVRAFWREREWN